MKNTTTNRLLPVVALAGVALLGTSCATDVAGAGDETESSLLSAGSGDELITLPVPFAVGQEATTEVSASISIDIDGLGVSESLALDFGLMLSESVVEVDEEGGAVIHNTIDAVEVTDAPEGVDLSTFEDVVGVTVEEHRNAQGVSESSEVLDDDSLTDEQRLAAEELLGSVETAAFAFPDGEVGVGARWTEEQSVASGGVEVPVTYEYELVELTAETYTVELTIDSEIDEDVDGLQLAGAYTGDGTVTGARDNPLELTADFEIRGDFEMEAEGEDATMAVAIAVGMAPAGSSPQTTATTVG